MKFPESLDNHMVCQISSHGQVGTDLPGDDGEEEGVAGEPEVDEDVRGLLVRRLDGRDQEHDLWGAAEHMREETPQDDNNNNNNNDHSFMIDTGGGKEPNLLLQTATGLPPKVHGSEF